MRALLSLCALLLTAPPVLADPVTVTDRRGSHAFDSPPKRIAALDWSIAESLLDLGIDPVGVAEPEAYATWVVEPALPDSAVDLGLRAEPNFEALAVLDPDVIVTADLDPALVPALERIAPVIVFSAYDAGHDNAAAARQIFLSLGDLTGRRDRAEELLAQQDAELATIATRLAVHFGDRRPMVTSIRLNDATSAYVNGPNSVPFDVLGRLGFKSELTMVPSRWGITLVPIDRLAGIESGIVLTLGPEMSGAGMRDTPLWGFLPFVVGGREARVRPVWSYGGAMSAGRMARAFEEALMTIAPSTVSP